MNREEAKQIKYTMPDVPARNVFVNTRTGYELKTPAIIINGELYMGFSMFQPYISEYKCKRMGIIKSNDLFYANIMCTVKKMISYRAMMSPEMQEHIREYNKRLEWVEECNQRISSVSEQTRYLARETVAPDFFDECNSIYQSYKDARKLAKMQEEGKVLNEEKKEFTIAALVDMIEAKGFNVTLTRKIVGG